jgi:hypothetical protein
MPRVRDNEVDVNGKKYGEQTIITINLKTLVIIIGILISGLTTAYLNLSSKIESSSQSTSNDIKDLSKEMKELRERELPNIREDVKGIDSKVNIIYDFVNRSNYQDRFTGQNENRPVSNQVPKAPN